jgi:hypothetical protein
MLDPPTLVVPKSPANFTRLDPGRSDVGMLIGASRGRRCRIVVNHTGALGGLTFWLILAPGYGGNRAASTVDVQRRHPSKAAVILEVMIRGAAFRPMARTAGNRVPA